MRWDNRERRSPRRVLAIDVRVPSTPRPLDRNGRRLVGDFEYDFVSLVLAMVGLFFICWATIHKKPRHILEEAFGLSTGRLRDFKASILKRNQVVMGYVFVVLAIVNNLFGSSSQEENGVIKSWSFSAKLALLVGSLALLCGLLNYLCRLWSKSSFKRHLVEIVTERQFPFEKNLPLTQEIGKLLGVPLVENDTVESYVARVRQHLNIPQPPPTNSSSRRLSRFG